MYMLTYRYMYYICINACMYTCMSIFRVTLHCNSYLPQRKESTILATFL